ncbi:ankyrin 2,3/unc44-like protein [Monoraphidium neglectum]|uniref:Ankyrin 2,3/unc44-like protein n=1 Tax=Monoraphidium neglectum TaxID=145388 RepID=A0A0D2IYN7_9CHLO|nr:ankyrin 2,3/unc44-like protein [Monoraphidium neglectum]KIY93007.1 ankyrin 2,3/unc44-like protein [Monoraphidium neglectum]|eukprot:XP_013892027.1 ankyrin 2,3/unc44-like protein [Monoraphidium neglectum]
MVLSSLSMPLGGARRVAAALEGIPSAAVVEDGEGGGPGQEWDLTLQQQRIVGDLLRLRQLVHKAVSKMDQSQLEALLYAAGSGEAEAVQALLRQGMSPDSANAEGTTPLILAASKGHNDVVLALLFNGADPSKRDAGGRSPLLLACQGNHPGVVDILLRHGAKLGMEPVMLAAYLCKIVFEGKIDELRRVLRARADPNAVDYDKQSPLHIAAAEGNLPAARVLVEQGRASLLLADSSC